jgi:putative ABC transport system substrate-binding protein
VLARVIAFREGLEALGWIENRNIRIEHRYSGGDLGRIRTYATELVHSAPNVIVGSGTPITAALKEATSTIPIVFNLVNDPVGQGFVASLSQPGGNITGFTFIDFPLIGKWLEMIKEIAPGVRHIALMFNPDTTPFYPAFLHELEAANKSLVVELSASPVHDEAEVEAAITALAREAGGGLIAAPDAFINNHRRTIMTLTERRRLPAIYGFRQFAIEGALISYGPSTADIVRRSAGYVDHILKGERPADLPVQAPTKYELVVNLKTAKALGIEIPPALLARSDEVIE